MFCLSALLVLYVSSALTVNNGDPFSPPERPVVNNDVDSNMLDLVKKLRDDVFANSETASGAATRGYATCSRRPTCP